MSNFTKILLIALLICAEEFSYGDVPCMKKKVSEARTAYESGEYEKSLEICLSLIKDENCSRRCKQDAKFLMILNYQKQEKFNEEIIEILEFIDLYPENKSIPGLYSMLSLAYWSVNKLDLAIQTCQFIIENYPQKAGKAQHLLGSIYYFDNKIKEAELELRKAINNYPNDQDMSDSIYKLARLVSSYKVRLDESIELFERLLREYPNSKYAAEAQHFLGHQYELKNDYKNALKNFEIAIKKYPDFRTADLTLSTVASIYWRQNEYKRAIYLYEKLIKGYSKSQFVGDAKHNLGFLYYKEENNERAFTTLKEAIKEYPDNIFIDRSWFFLGMIYEKNKEYDKARQIFDRLIKENPETFKEFKKREKVEN